MAKNARSKFHVVFGAYLCPMIRIGIIGGGQLGMMSIEAKYQSLPVEFTVLEQSNDCPAAAVANNFVAGSLQNANDIQTLASQSDVLTWEIEHINVDALIALEREGKTIIPKPSVLKTIQDKESKNSFLPSITSPQRHTSLPISTKLPRNNWINSQGKKWCSKPEPAVTMEKA